jgi:hypothetical protein
MASAFISAIRAPNSTSPSPFFLLDVVLARCSAAGDAS